MYFTPHNVVASSEVNLNQKSGKNWRIFLMFRTSQIVNLKKVGNVFGPKKRYQCGGGETLDPVVKHSVSDSTRVWFSSISS